MRYADYLRHDATSLAQLVAEGVVTPLELLETALARHAEVHGRVNAICRLMEEQARAQLARPLSGPFAGVPFLIKDCAQDYAGLPTTNGSRSMRGLSAWASTGARLPVMTRRASLTTSLAWAGAAGSSSASSRPAAVDRMAVRCCIWGSL